MTFRKTCFMALTMALLITPAFAQVGIFDGQADWDLNDGTKVAGSVTESDGVYTLQGNGNDIWGANDEGFYAYTSKPSNESWLLSGKIAWVEPGGSEWAKFGPMVRVDAEDSGSPNAFLLNKGLQNFMRAAQRPAYGADTNDGGDLYDSTGATAYSGNEVWMRMGYYAPLNLVYGEISLDGQNWQHVLTTSFDFGDNVNYGFAITNHDPNEVIAIGEVSDVSFEPLTSAPSILGPGAGEFDYNVDVGLRHLPGESSYDASSDTYTVTGSGPDIWDNNDGFQYLFKEMNGAFEAEAEMFITAPGDGEWTKGGMMVRADLGSAAPHGFAMQQTDGDSQIEIRINPGDNTSDQGLQPFGDTTSRYRIVKVGSIVQYYYEDLSGNWVLDGEGVINIGDNYLFGLAITAHNNTLLGTMEVSGLQITEYPFDVDRKASVASYLPGEVFDTHVNVAVREGQTVSSLTITENLPPEATSVSNISDGGVLAGDTITWNLSNVSGSKSLSYALTAPSDINVASMNWSAGSASGSGMDIAFGGPLQIQILTFNASETFAYPDGNDDNGFEGEPLADREGGFGWGGGNPWVQAGDSAEDITLILDTLDAGIVQSQPTQFNPGNYSVQLTGDCEDGIQRNLPQVVSGGELWISYTYREEGPAVDHWSGITLYNDSGAEVAFVGKPFGSEFLGIGNLPGGDQLTDKPYNVNNHILVRISLAGNESSVYMWVNPDKQDRFDTFDASGPDEIGNIASLRMRRGAGGGSSAFYDNLWISSVPALPPTGAGRVDLRLEDPDALATLPGWDVISIDQIDDAQTGVPGFGHDNGNDHYLIISGFIYFTDVTNITGQIVSFGLPVDHMSGLNGHILGPYNNQIDEQGLKNSIKFQNNDAQRGPFTFELDPPGNYAELRSAQTVGNGDGQLLTTLNYEDGTTDSVLINADDWFNDGGEIRYANTRQLVDGMDRLAGGTSDFQDSNDPAMFEKAVPVNSDKVLVSVTLELDVSGNNSDAGVGYNLFDIWALPAGGTAVQDWALY